MPSAARLLATQADVPRLPAILRAISQTRVAELQSNLAIVRPRFGYSSLAANELRLAEPGALASDYLPKLAAHSEQHEDAMQTLIRILLFRAYHRSKETGREVRVLQSSN